MSLVSAETDCKVLTETSWAATEVEVDRFLDPVRLYFVYTLAHPYDTSAPTHSDDTDPPPARSFLIPVEGYCSVP